MSKQFDDVITDLESLSRIREGFAAVAEQASHSGEIMMMLGPFMFALDTAAYKTFRRRSSYDWARQDALNRRPRLQWTGPGDEEIELHGLIYPEFAGGLKQVTAMRELAGLARPYMLVDGLGFVYQKWVIQEVEETTRFFFANGQPRKIEFRLRLGRYQPDESLTALASRFLGKLKAS